MHVGNGISIAKEVEHQRGGDVVGQVAEYAQRLTYLLRQLTEVHGHGILLINRQFRPQKRVRLQTRGQIAVKFDHRELVQTFADRLRQRRQTGADFDHCLTLLRVNGGDNTVDHKLIVEKVLPEAFTG